MSWTIRYTPGTDLARRWPDPIDTRWNTRAAAEAVRRQCANAASMEVLEVEGP